MQTSALLPLSVFLVAACSGVSTTALAQSVTQMYSFESGLEGFGPNGSETTVSLNTDLSFVSEGVQSMKAEITPFGSFEGLLTNQIDAGILNDPPGVDFIRFDFINTNRFAPDDPQQGDPTFANVGVTLFGEFASAPGVAETIQFLATEQPIGNLEPGTYEIDIDVSTGGLLVDSSEVKGFNEWIADGLTLSGFQLYVNKNFGVTPEFGWTIYFDDIRAGMSAQAVPGDYNEDGVVDAADYTFWRDRLGQMIALPNTDPVDVDNMVTADEYAFWVSRFGQTSGSGSLSAAQVPEPAAVSIMLVAAAAGWRIIKQRS